MNNTSIDNKLNNFKNELFQQLDVREQAAEDFKRYLIAFLKLS